MACSIMDCMAAALRGLCVYTNSHDLTLRCCHMLTKSVFVFQLQLYGCAAMQLSVSLDDVACIVMLWLSQIQH